MLIRGCRILLHNWPRQNVSTLKLSYFTYTSITGQRVSIVPTTNKPFFRPVIQYRLIRTKGSKGEEKSENGSESTYSSGGEKDGKKNPNEEFAEKLKDLEKEFRKRMEQLQKEGKIDAKSVVFSKTLDFGRVIRRFIFLSVFTGFFISIVIFNYFFGAPKDNEYEAYFNAPHILFDVFLNKYLPTGEVKRVIHFPMRRKALAFLFDNAIIDGVQMKTNHVVIDLDVAHADPIHFRSEIRIHEKKLGIELKDGIHIDERRDISVLKMIEFMMGCTILIWLSFMYGRVMRRAYDQWKTKNKSPPSGNGSS